MTRAQRALLKGIEKWNELPPDAEDRVGGCGAVLRSVIDACIRRGWVIDGDYLTITQAGRDALANDPPTLT